MAFGRNLKEGVGGALIGSTLILNPLIAATALGQLESLDSTDKTAVASEVHVAKHEFEYLGAIDALAFTGLALIISSRRKEEESVVPQAS